MTPRTLSTLARPCIALTCSLALALPTGAHARESEPEPDAAAADAEVSDELSEQAQQHVLKAYQQYQNRSYATAEAELRRAAFFAPRWRPLHFNLAVMAEAQGKLGTAVSEYKAFQPFASPDESIVAEQRIVELDDRRRKIAGAYKRQIAVGASTMTLGVGMLGGGGALIGIYYANKTTTKTGATDTPAEDTSKSSAYASAGYLVGLVGLLVLVYSIVPLRKAVQAKRQLNGLALGPTRLRLAGGGVSLRF